MITELLEQREKALDYENWEELFKKIEGDFDFGNKIEVQWVDREDSDYGYLFTLPEMDGELNDFFIHVPSPDNSDGIGPAPEVHIHALELASFERVKKIKILSKN